MRLICAATWLEVPKSDLKVVRGDRRNLAKYSAKFKKASATDIADASHNSEASPLKLSSACRAQWDKCWKTPARPHKPCAHQLHCLGTHSKNRGPAGSAHRLSSRIIWIDGLRRRSTVSSDTQISVDTAEELGLKLELEPQKSRSSFGTCAVTRNRCNWTSSVGVIFHRLSD